MNRGTVCILGLGTVGLPTAQECQKRSLTVYGYDTDSDAVEKAQQQGINATSDWDSVPQVDVYEVCVPTHNIYQACSLIAQKSGSDTLVAIESTVLPHTTRIVYNQIFDGKGYVVHVPHRYWSQQPQKRGTNQLRVIGAVNSRSLHEGLSYFRDILKILLHPVESAEVAELCKLAENSHRYLNIAFAENLKLICDEQNLDFDAVRDACNSKWNTFILEARDGIGGDCLPLAVASLAAITKHGSILKSAISLDETYKKKLSTIQEVKT